MAQSITVNGNTYNDSPYDAATNPNGLANGGWRVNSKFITMLLDTLADATTLSRTTSTTSLTISTGAIGPLTLFQDVPLSVGDFVLISDSTAPTTNWMVGQITTRTDNDITVDVTKTEGSGTLSSWTVHLSAYPGDTGATGPAGTDGAEYWLPTVVEVDNTDSPVTVVDRTIYLADTSTASITFDMPATGRAKIIDVGGAFATNAAVLNPPSGETIMGGAADETYDLNENNRGYEVRRRAAVSNWRVWRA